MVTVRMPTEYGEFQAVAYREVLSGKQHADAPEWVGILSELVWRVRPKAEIEFTSTLGAVVSTHAGPGTVGFFWFQDDA